MSTPSSRPDTDHPIGLNRPTKHFRLVCWRLLYHLDVRKYLDRQDEIEACRHARLSLGRWDSEKIRCPKEWTKLLAKRLRRFVWFTEHGSIKPGWCPPDPQDPRRTANKPIAAYLARRHTTVHQFYAKNALLPMLRKKGGHRPNWKLIRRVCEWINES